MATPIQDTTYQRGQDVANTGVKERGVIGRKLVDFYQTARGHLPNRYEVYFYGPYVEEALHVMDRNSYADKYTMTEVKTFPNTLDYYKKNQFDDWFSHAWDDNDKTLCMRWNAKSIDVPGAKADTQWFMIDSTKSMSYPLVVGNKQPDQLALTVLDDSYMMWFQFFNALYNVQFSPLVLKPRSTLQKINMYVNMYYEAITMGRSHDNRTFLPQARTSDVPPVITDIDVGQMFEFNSCVVKNAPQVKMSYDSAEQYTFTVNMEYPNSFQGSFKKKFRYLRDNTTKGIDVADAMTKKSTDSSPYGEYNKGFYETPYATWQNRQSAYTYETYNPNDYKEYMKTHPAAFKSADKYSYDIHDIYKK
jgi:hypothetical protein